jgi:hypothetical protein
MIRSTTVLRDAANKLADLVEVKVIVSGKNVQGPWYRTTVRHEVNNSDRRCQIVMSTIPNGSSPTKV